MNPWRVVRGGWRAGIWQFANWLAERRAPQTRDEDIARLVCRHQTRGMSLRMTEWLRDRLRPQWLRVRHEDESGDDA